MDIVLIAGLWLDGSAWDNVVPALTAAGHRPVAVTLPGQGDGAQDASLADQVAAVVAAVDTAVDASRRPALVVGHSAACTLAWLVADRRPDRVAAAILIGGMPSTPGTPYADFVEPTDGVVPFPGWEPFEGPDIADLTPALRASVAARTVPIPEAVTRGQVDLHDERRYDVPVVMVCPEYSPDEAKAWVEAGEIPELAKARSVEYVDIDSGHWPMFTKPEELARIIATVADHHSA